MTAKDCESCHRVMWKVPPCSCGKIVCDACVRRCGVCAKNACLLCAGPFGLDCCSCRRMTDGAYARAISGPGLRGNQADRLGPGWSQAIREHFDKEDELYRRRKAQRKSLMRERLAAYAQRHQTEPAPPVETEQL